MYSKDTATRRGSTLLKSINSKNNLKNKKSTTTVVIDTSATHHDTTNGWSDDSDQSLDESSYYVPSIPFNQRLAALDPALYQGSGDDFCTEENYDQTSAYINHQLNIHGFSSSLQFIGADKHAASRIVTALYKILQQHLKDSEYKEEMDLNWRRLSQDYDTTLHNLNVTKTQLEKSERETDMLSARIAALEDEVKVETEKHRYTREELKSAKANLQYSKTQYAHESRKKEQEVNALKEKLQKSISRGQSFSSSSSTIPGGITILNPVPRSLHGKTHTNEAELLLKEVIEQQQAKENEIVEENEQLRRTLYTVQVELEGLLKKHSNLKNSSNNAYGLPFEMVKDRIETEIRDTLTLMSDQWNHRPSMEPVISPSEIVVRDQRIEDLQKEIEKLQLELEDSTLLVQGAQKMIDNLSSGNYLAGLQDLKLNVEGSDMTLQEIDEAEAKIRKQREDLAKERKRFTQACLDLGKEREELQRAKDEFEESKRTFRLDKVVDFLSFSPVMETAARTPDVSPPSSVPAPAYAPTRGRAPVRAPPSPTPAMGAGSRKRVATSPLPYFSTLDNGRSVRPKTKTTVIEVPDDDDDEDEHGVAVPEQGQAQEQWRRNQNTAVSDEDEQLEGEEEDEQLIRTNNHNNIKAHKATKDSFPTFGVPGMPRGTFGSTTVAGAARVGRLGSENQTTTTSVIATADGSSLKPTTTLGSSTPGRSRPSSTFTTSTPTPFVISFNDPSLSTPTPRPQTLVAPVTSSVGSSSTLAAAAKSQPFNFTATLPPNTTFKSLSSRPVVSASAPTSATAVPTLSFNPRINNNDKNGRPSTTTSTTTPSSSSVPAIATSVQFPSLNASVRMPSALTKAAAHLASRKAGITAAPSTSSSKSGASLFSFTDTRRATESGPDSRSGSVPSSIFSRRPKT